MNKVYDYAIVGQGIAGSILAYQLQKKAKSFILFDSGIKQSSSYVAAGIMNPLVLKRLTKTWRAEEFLAYNQDFYPNLNQTFDRNYFQQLKINKLISSEDEKRFWEDKIKSGELENFISSELEEVNPKNHYQKDFLKGRVKNCSWIDLKGFLPHMRKTLESRNQLIEEVFHYLSLQDSGDHLTYRQFQFNKIIFCDGAKVVHNPFFNYIPMGLNKGELLQLKIPDLNIKEALKKDVFILPLENDEYRVGASFEWRWKEESPSDKKRKELFKSFENICKLNAQIVNHEAGVRPSVKDRRPLLGSSEDNKKIYIFNGLGSRGCFMAPLLSKELIAHMEYGEEVHPEADIRRFKPD